MADKYSYSIEAKDRTRGAVRSATRGLNNLQGTIGRIDGAIAKLTGGLAVLAGVGGIGALVNSTSQAVDRLGKLSDQLGISAQSIRELELVASEAGVSSDQLSTALATLQRNATDASRGTGEARVAFDALGISAEDFVNLPVDRQLEVIADSFANLENASDRTNTVMKIFGESGRALIPMLNQGSGGIQDVRQEARELGGTLSQDGVDGLEAMNDSVGKLTFALKSQLQNALVELAPEILEVTNLFVDWAKTRLPDIMENLGGYVSELGDALGSLISDIQENRVGFSSLYDVVEALIGKWGALIATSWAFIAVGKKLLDTLNLIRLAFAMDVPDGAIFEKWSFGFTRLGKTIAEAKLQISTILGQLSGPRVLGIGLIAGAIAAIVTEVIRWRNEVNRVRDSLKEAKEEAEEFVDRLNTTGRQATEKAFTQTYNEVIKLEKELPKLQTELSRVQEQLSGAVAGLGQGKSGGDLTLANQLLGRKEDLELRIDRLRTRLGVLREELLELQDARDVWNDFNKTSEEYKSNLSDISEWQSEINAGLTTQWESELKIRDTARETYLYQKGITEEMLARRGGLYAEDEGKERNKTEDTWQIKGIKKLAEETNLIAQDFGFSMSQQLEEVMRDEEMSHKLLHVAENFGRWMGDALQNAAISFVARLTQELMAMFAKFIIVKGFSAILNAIVPGSGSAFEGFVNGISGMTTGGSTGSGAPEIASMVNTPSAIPMGGDNTVVLQSVIPPTQADLRRAQRTLNESQVSYRRFALA